MNGSVFLNIIATLCLLLANVSFAELQWGGSYENTIWGYRLSETSSLMDENRLRLDMNVAAGRAVSFTGDIIFKKHFGKTSYDISQFVPKNISKVLLYQHNSTPEDFRNTELAYNYRDTFYVDNAAIAFETGRTILTAGIQQLPWGCGYAWNPTDLWNVKDILDPGYDKPGKAAIKLEHGIGPVSITAVTGFANDYRHAPWTTSFSATIAGFEATALAAYRSVTSEVAIPVYISFSAEELSSYVNFDNLSERYVFGYSLSGQFLDLGVHSEGAVNRRIQEYSLTGIDKNALTILDSIGIPLKRFKKSFDYTQTYISVVAGTDYTFGIGNGLFIMSEYFYNVDGAKNDERYSTEDWMEYLAGDKLSMGRHTLYSGISYSFTDLSTLALYSIVNISDGSIALNPWLTISITDDCELDISGAIPIGDEEDEFGRDQYMGRARLKVFW